MSPVSVCVDGDGDAGQHAAAFIGNAAAELGGRLCERRGAGEQKYQRGDGDVPETAHRTLLMEVERREDHLGNDAGSARAGLWMRAAPGLLRRLLADERLRRGELGRVDRDVRLHLVQSDRVLPVGPGDDDLERHLHAGNVTVIGVVDLRRHRADRRPVPAHAAHEEARVIEVEVHGLAAGSALQDLHRFVVDRRAPDLPAGERVLDGPPGTTSALRYVRLPGFPRSVPSAGAGATLRRPTPCGRHTS